jgi:hypothetical protein
MVNSDTSIPYLIHEKTAPRDGFFGLSFPAYFAAATM